jgi:hypothetical protein
MHSSSSTQIMGGQPTAGHGPRFEVDIEGTIHEWARETITTAEIIGLGGWSPDQGVVEVNLKTQEERTLAPDEIVELKPGHGFAKKVKFQRG